MAQKEMEQTLRPEEVCPARAFRTSAEQNKRGPAALSKFRALPQFFVHTGGQDGKYPSALILFSTNLHV